MIRLAAIPYTVTRRVPALVIVPDSPAPRGGHPVTLALHGMGESAESFATVLEPAIAHGRRAWVIPTAPHAFEKRRERGLGHAWYLFAGDQELLRASMIETSGWLAGLMETLHRSATSNDTQPGPALNLGAIDVLGFSQGGYLASVLWMHMTGIARVICMGGRLKQEWWPESATPAPRFLHLHGSADESVPVTLARDAAEAAKHKGFDVTFREFATAGHTVTADMLAAYAAWV